MLIVFRKLSHPLCSQCRCISAYKISSKRYPRKKILSNYNDEEAFNEKVDLAVLDRARSKLRGFEKITDWDLLTRQEGSDPNAPFRHQDEANKYRSLWRYYKAAERERRRQRQSGHDIWWKNLNFWLKQEYSHPTMEDIGFKFSEMNDCYPQKVLSKPEVADDIKEKLSRHRELNLDIDSTIEDWQRSKSGIKSVQQVAHHYNIFTDLFGDKDFHSVIPMEIMYPASDEYVNPVYIGNELAPFEVKLQPHIQYDAGVDKLYTLLLTNPDGHLEDNDMEYVHWLVGNIPGNDILQGEVLVDYMQPIPARGTGFHRHVFILFEQDGNITYDSEKVDQPCTSLRKRDFKTCQFYQRFSKHLIPVSLRFFQCKWDYSVQRMFQDTLKMPEPVYEYEKLSEEPKLSTLKRNNTGKTLQWLSRFMPKEMVFPDGSPESQRLRVEAAAQASASKDGPYKTTYPVQNVY